MIKLLLDAFAALVVLVIAVAVILVLLVLAISNPWLGVLFVAVALGIWAFNRVEDML